MLALLYNFAIQDVNASNPCLTSILAKISQHGNDTAVSNLLVQTPTVILSNKLSTNISGVVVAVPYLKEVGKIHVAAFYKYVLGKGKLNNGEKI